MSEGTMGAPEGRSAGWIVPRILMVVAALGFLAAFFLPWASANAEFREAVTAAPDLVFYEPTDMTVSDAVDISLFEYAQVYGSMGSGWQVYMAIMYAVLGASALTLLLAAFGKPIGAAVVGALAFAGSRLLVWDFGDRGVLPSSTHDWGMAATVYIPAFVVLLVAAVWLFVLKRRAKAGANV